MAPKRHEAKNPSGESYCAKETDLFGAYLDAVWLAGIEPYGNGGKNSKEDIIRAEIRKIEAENYWSGDPGLEDKKFSAPDHHVSDYIIPTLEEITDHTEFSKSTIQRYKDSPNMRIGSRPSSPRSEQDRIMEMVEGSETYRDLLEEAENNGITRGRVELMLDPTRGPEKGGSYGRWMDSGSEGNQGEFPENTPLTVWRLL